LDRDKNKIKRILQEMYSYSIVNAVVLMSQYENKTKYSNDIEVNKYKAVPLQAWSGPEGSRKLRFPDFMTTAQEGGKVVSPTHRPPLPPGNTPGSHFC
jgi:hypothetical protein